MRRTLSIFVTLSILFSVQVSMAHSAAVFAASSTKIVNDLRAQGIHHVGDLDLDKLSHEIEGTRWSSVQDKFLLGSGKDRTTSVYLTKQRQVIVNALSLQNIPQDVYPQVALHEALGANGYEDENSQVSLTLDQLAKNPKIGKGLLESQLKNVAPTVKENKSYKSNSQGGGTSVGGGGDGTTIEFKKRLLQLAIDKLAEDSTVNEELQNKVLQKILDMDIEPDWHVEKNQMELYEDPKLGTQLVIPSVMWVFLKYDGQSGELKKTKMVDTVLQKFLQDAS